MLSSERKKKKMYVFDDEVRALNKRFVFRKRLAKMFKSFCWLLVVFGVWQLLGKDLYQEHVQDWVVPPIRVYPGEVRFNRKDDFREQRFHVENTSKESHFNIELQVWIENLDERYEVVELRLPREVKLICCAKYPRSG